MTITATTTATAVPAGPPPPFDPELAAGLAALGELPTTLTADMIPALRQLDLLPPVTDDDLRSGGAFEVEKRTVPGPPGARPVDPTRRQAGGRTTENLAHAKSPLRASRSRRSSVRRGSRGAPPPSVTGAIHAMTSSSSLTSAN